MIRFTSLFGEHNTTLDELNEKAKAYALEKGFDYHWNPMKPYNGEQAIQLLAESDVGLIDIEPYDASVFSRIIPRCKLLIRFGVGFENVNLKDASNSGIAVARTTGANATGVAEMALTLILAAGRKLEKNRRVIENGVWAKNIGHELLGGTVGIVGFGQIGQVLARLLQGFSCRILAYDPMADEEKMRSLNVNPVSFEQLLEQSDAISIHVPYCAATHHMFNAQAISRMKKSAVLVCTARGNIVDEEALCAALDAGEIAGAGLDVFEREPLPLSSALIGRDDVILTPHMSSQTVESLWAIYKKAIDIAADFFAGNPISRADLLNPDYKLE